MHKKRFSQKFGFNEPHKTSASCEEQEDDDTKVFVQKAKGGLFPQLIADSVFDQ